MVLYCICLVGYKEHGVMVVMLDGVMVGMGVPGYEWCCGVMLGMGMLYGVIKRMVLWWLVCLVIKRMVVMLDSVCAWLDYKEHVLRW